MEFMFDWENEADRFSFDDSERFEEESMCSWISEPESLNNNWRGWKRQNGGQNSPSFGKVHDNEVLSLVELASQTVACHIPFEVVEKYPQPIPEPLQLRITFWSFPDSEEDIRLYSCLANGSADEFQKGDHLYKNKAVKDTLQIGFHLSATVEPPQNLGQTKGNFKVAIMFDRRRISSCTCSCNSSADWCCHVVAVCLFRIHQCNLVTQRAPVSESLSRLHRDQLQKFAQYLITELPQQILPTAQRLLDELLSSQENDMNKYQGAPDPTAGPSASEETSWSLDESTLHENVKKTLVKFCVPSPTVFSDVNFLTQTAPPAAAEWQSLLRPLRGREPEGMWNLLSIAREMFRRSDHNAIPLMEIITDEVLQCEQILIWWFTTKVSGNSNNQISTRSNSNSSASITQHAASSLCDEIVGLWRLAALNPKLSPIQKDDLCAKFKEWHISTIEKVKKARNNNSANSGGVLKKSEIENFAGFKPGIEACLLFWDDYHIPGVTYSVSQKLCLRYRFNRVTDPDAKKPSRIQPMTICSENLISTDDMTTLAQATNMLNEHHSPQDIKNKRHRHPSRQGHNNDGAMSSGSEGFCEPERGSSLFRDSDSGSEMKEPNSRSNSFEDNEVFGVFTLENLESKRNLERRQQVDHSHVFDEDSYMDLGARQKPGPSDGRGTEPAQIVVGGNAEQSSESQVSGDEYSVYFYDRAKATEAEKKRKEKSNEEPNYFAGVKKLENAQEILFARAEALHAHGHTKEACQLAQQLAEELLANPPDLLAECAAVPNVKGRKKKALTSITLLCSSTVSKAAFLCSVLLEEHETWHLAFKMGMFVLEMPRPPASCKALEVKLAYQETELLTLLKKIPLGPDEMDMLRQRAEQLKDGSIKSRGEALLPLTLASFIFDALCLGSCPMAASPTQVYCKQPGDEKLGFEGCVAALGMKANVSEAEHPLLCESTRKQRGELTISMLTHYKDDVVKLSKVMDKLLDKEVHQSYKGPSLVTYLTPKNASNQSDSLPSKISSSTEGNTSVPGTSGSQGGNATSGTRASELDDITLSNQADRRQGAAASTSGGGGGARPKTTYGLYNRDTDSSNVEEEGDDYKALEAKLRCMSLKKKPSQGMAAIDSSAPETTSSDNSPTLVRRVWSKHQGPGSDSGSSGDSDSLGSSSSGDKAELLRSKLRDESPQTQLNNRMAATSQFIMDSRSSTPNTKGNSVFTVCRFKGKSRIMPTVPNQPSEASAHWMWEVAKTVLSKAGGSSSTSQFIPTNNTQHTGPHRNLQICAFMIGLYALGLQNCVAPNWLSRTYSSHVSWITGQAMEIGTAAIHILIDTWEGHLTPPEVATLADRASRGRDHNIVKAAAELALSCLPQAQALNPSEVQRALFQCKEQSKDMLEKACLAVESAAKGGGVYPEVLFHVAKRWFELSEEASTHDEPSSSRASRDSMAAHSRPSSTGSMPPVSSAQPPRERSSPAHPPCMPFSNGSPNPTNHVTVTGAHILSHNGQIATQAVVLPFQLPPQPGSHHPHHQLPHQQAYVQPTYNIVQQIQPLMPPYSQSIPLQHMHHPYMATLTYQNHPPYNNMPQSVYTSASPFRPLGHAQGVQVLASQNCQVTSIQGLQPPPAPLPLPQSSGEDVSPAHTSGTHHNYNPVQAHYIHASFRVGLLAMETLARRVHDDRPQTKYARNPPNGEDVKWLLGISMKLGTSCVQQFTASVVNAVVSPFLLYDIAIEAAHAMARHNPVGIQNHLRSSLLNPLVQKCLQMFIQCAHQRMHHINASEYDDFVSTICCARNAFYLTPGGMVQFQELLQNLRRSKFCRKELWQRIVNGLQTPITV